MADLAVVLQESNEGRCGSAQDMAMDAGKVVENKAYKSSG
jgi:hypothetical protein